MGLCPTPVAGATDRWMDSSFTGWKSAANANAASSPPSTSSKTWAPSRWMAPVICRCRSSPTCLIPMVRITARAVAANGRGTSVTLQSTHASNPGESVMSSPSNLKRNWQVRGRFHAIAGRPCVALIRQPAGAASTSRAPPAIGRSDPSNILYILDDSGMPVRDDAGRSGHLPPTTPPRQTSWAPTTSRRPTGTIYGSDTYGWGNASQVLIPVFTDTSFQSFTTSARRTTTTSFTTPPSPNTPRG